MKDQQNQGNSNEEFSIEFGDVNGVKLFEVLNKSNQKKKNSKHEKEKSR